MNDLLLIAAKGTDACRGIGPIVSIIRHGVFPLVQIGIPILLILLGTFDLGKAVISSDDKEVKAAQKRLISRLIYAAVIFFMVTFVSVVMNVVATGNLGEDADTNSWETCWKNA